MNEMVLLLTGPSGSGKTTVCRALLEEMPERLAKPVSVTTRQPRAGEVHGVDYYFVSTHGFVVMQERGDFLETSIGNGQHYGLLRRELRRIVDSGKTPLIVCDTEGVDNYHALGVPYRAVFLYVERDQLAKRILARGYMTHSEFGERMDRAVEEKVWCGRRLKYDGYHIKRVENREYELDYTLKEVKQCFGLI